MFAHIMTDAFKADAGALQGEFNMTGVKPFYSSLTIQGAIVAVLPIILSLLGVDLGVGGENIVSQAVEQGIQLVGIVMVIVGRYRANKRIGNSPDIGAA
jgi:hypothetical protein